MTAAAPRVALRDECAACLLLPTTLCLVCVGRRVHDVHLLRGRHILECRCVKGVPAALPPFPRTP